MSCLQATEASFSLKQGRVPHEGLNCQAFQGIWILRSPARVKQHG